MERSVSAAQQSKRRSPKTNYRLFPPGEGRAVNHQNRTIRQTKYFDISMKPRPRKEKVRPMLKATGIGRPPDLLKWAKLAAMKRSTSLTATEGCRRPRSSHR